MTDEVSREDDFIDRIKQKAPTPLVIAAVLAISIGQFNDTIDMTGQAYEIILSNFSDAPSNKRLSKIYIRASSHVLDETFGAPVYTKYSDGNTQIHYYKDNNFIISALTSNQTIDAFLVFPESGFEPNTIEHAGGDQYLSHTFSQSTPVVSAASNIARSGNYYLEEAEGGRYELLYTSIGGYSEYLSSLTDSQRQDLGTFNDQLMMEENTDSSLKLLREHIQPNFYGYSTVDLSLLEPAILTRLEYELISK